jgi:chemosensory pili system protein ChpC
MDATTQLLRTLLIPLESSQVLLPSTTVTEVLPLRAPAATDGLDWMLGSIAWRGKRIPVVSLDMLFDGIPSGDGSRARLAVLNAVGDGTALEHYAVITQSIPRLVTLQPEMIEAEEVAMLPDGVLSRARVARQLVYIPDLDWIEQHLRDLAIPIAA